MIVHEHDPDVVRWGLHLLDVCSLTNDGSRSAVTRYDEDSGEVGYVREGYQDLANSGYVREGYQGPVNSGYVREGYQPPVDNGYLREGYLEPMHAYTENDAVIACALQEEYSRLAAAEASGVSHFGQDAILAQNWLGPMRSPDGSGNGEIGSPYCGSTIILLYCLPITCSLLNCVNCVGLENDQISANDPSTKTREVEASSKNDAFDANDYGRKEEPHDPCKTKDEEGDELGIMCSSFSSDEKSLIPEYLLHTIEITDDDSVLDGEVGKRLNQMVPVPHVPKINGEIPSADEEISDHQRLLERLQLYELVENKVQGDGNCQFRAISDQLYRAPDHHKFVREQLVKQLKSHPQKYMGYVPMGYTDYLKKMSKSGEWGDHVTLQAAADWFGVKIFVITSFKDTCYIEIMPEELKSKRVIFLSFWAEVHYNSIYPAEELPLLESKKKKKWWMLGS